MTDDVLALLILIFSGATRCVYNEGMPIYRNPFEKGNLYIKFELTFPPNQFANEKQLKVCMNKTCFLRELQYACNYSLHKEPGLVSLIFALSKY